MEPGGITELPQVFDFYREGFSRSINAELLKKRKYKVVIDFNHSPAGQLLPAIMNALGIEVISLNAYVDEVRGIKNADEKPSSLSQLSKIVASLEAQAGFWLDPTDEEVIFIDEMGRVYSAAEALPLMTALLLKAGHKGDIAVPVSAPSVIELMANEKGCAVRRTKNSERAMIEESLSSEMIMTGSMDGRFAFPKFQAAFDGMYTIAKTVEMLAACGIPLSALRGEIPRRTFLQSRVTCAWEMKGGIMRRMSEDSLDSEATFIDGIKVHFGEDWVLVLPDQYQPYVHIIAEGKDPKTVQKLLSDYQKKVEAWKKELH